MGFLRTDYSEVGGFGVLPVGEYECIVSAVEVTQTKETKKPMLKATLTIRDDIEQEGKKRKLFDNMVEQENMMWKFNQVAKACQLEEGIELETLADFATAIQYRTVRVKLGKRTYNGEEQNEIKGWMESKYEGGSNPANGEDPFAGNGQIDVSDDDLPF
jgi:hypothetical protein